MNIRNIVCFLLMVLALIGCGIVPKEGSIIIAGVTHIYSVGEYNRVSAGAEPINVYDNNVIYPTILAGIAEGVTLEDVQQGRFIMCECSCGPECYALYSVLLPTTVSVGEYGLIELEAGKQDRFWQSKTQTITLGKFRRLLNIPYKEWPRKHTHGLLPTCMPADWPN